MNTTDKESSSRSEMLGICVGVGAVDAAIAAGIGYAVSGTFLWPLFIGVFGIAMAVALVTLIFCKAAAIADDMAGTR